MGNHLWTYLYLISCYSLIPYCPGQDNSVNDGTRITQHPSPFIIYGNNNMTLTCQTNVDTGVQYTWFNGSLTGPRLPCEESTNGQNTCTYQPKIWDVNKAVLCTAAGNNSKVDRTIFTPNLQYPPQLTPQISIAPEPGGQVDIVETGSRLMCEVSGGKPLVENVNFYCESPQHGDMPDEKLNNSMVSSIAVTNFQDQDCQMTCNCAATWSPEPGLYQHNTNVILELVCPPEQWDTTFRNNTPTAPLNFTLKANPPPYTFRFTHLDSRLKRKKRDNSNSTLPYEFQAQCSLIPDTPYLSTCSVIPVKVPSQYLGGFTGTAISIKGSFEFHFQVLTEMPPPQIAPIRQSQTTEPWIIAVTTIACSSLGIGITIKIVCVIRKKPSSHYGPSSDFN